MSYPESAAALHEESSATHAVSARAGALALGVLSIVLGSALCARPEPLGAVFGLPRHRALLRALGVRDLLVGSLLCRARATAELKTALSIRAFCDTMDLGLMVANASSGHQVLGNLLLRAPGALALVGAELSLARAS